MRNQLDILQREFQSEKSLRVNTEIAFNKSVDKLILRIKNLERASREDEAYEAEDHKNTLV